MKRIPLEYLGKTAQTKRRFAKTKKIECIFFDTLQNKNVIKRGYLVMPFRAGYYDYTTDIINLFLQTMQIKLRFVSRATSKKSKTSIYHIYIF